MLNKHLIIISLYFLSFIIMAAKNERNDGEAENEIQLSFVNIEIENIIFENTSDIKVNSIPNNVTLDKQNNRITVKSKEENTKIDIVLPANLIYIYSFQNDENNSYCQFSKDNFYLYQNEKSVVKYEDHVLLIVDDKNNSGIRIDKNKTEIINEDGSITEISSEGIIRSNKNMDDQFNGFWGRIIGNALQFGINLAIDKIAETPAEMAKVFINTDLREIKNEGK